MESDVANPSQMLRLYCWTKIASQVKQKLDTPEAPTTMEKEQV